MSNNMIIIVGLKGKEFKNHIMDGDGDAAPPKTICLSYASYGDESSNVWHYNPRTTHLYCPEIIGEILKHGRGNIFGVYVMGTWNGAIELESIQEYIDEAKRIFKERSGQDGKVYIIGEQV